MEKKGFFIFGIFVFLLCLNSSHAIAKKDLEHYHCPPGFDLGYVNNAHYCYRIVSVPDAKRDRMVDENFCADFEKTAFPAVIKSEEENEFLASLPNYARLASITGLVLGLYIPINKPLNPTNFINRDGSKIVYSKWGSTTPQSNVGRLVAYKRIKNKNIWMNVVASKSTHLLCKTTAQFQPNNLSNKIQYVYNSYSCPNGWIMGATCGNHNCYRIVQVPKDKRVRMIDDNFCEGIDKRSFPASIHCEEENEFLSTKPFAPTAMKDGLGLGIYIPLNKEWDVKNFINRDGSKIDYAKWGVWWHTSYGPLQEPNGFQGKTFTERVVKYAMTKEGNGYLKTWHDVNNGRLTNVVCKMPAMGIGKPRPITTTTTTKKPTTKKPLPKTTTTRKVTTTTKKVITKKPTTTTVIPKKTTEKPKPKTTTSTKASTTTTRVTTTFPPKKSCLV